MRRLALFARWPEAGAVKTRLTPALPSRLACDLYRAMLDDAIALVAGASADERILYWSGAPAPDAAPGSPPGFGVRNQNGAHLGERLERAFDELLDTQGAHAVIVGADCPALHPSAIADAFAALDTNDVVLGRAHDGGYYLVGLARRAPALFRGIEWSTERVLERTLEHAARVRLTTALLPAHGDLDTPEDLLRWIACRAARGGPAAPRALDRALSAIGLLPPG